jgi:hypothetical protein
VKGLVEFAKWVMSEGPWMANELDPGDVQSKAIELGVIVATKYDPEIHGESELSEYVEPGDIWYVVNPALEALSRQPASGGSDPEAIRDAAIEECARLAEDMSTERLENPHEIWLHGFNVAQTAIGKAIRSLKSGGGKPLQSEGQR